jgi:hypothetical protein
MVHLLIARVLVREEMLSWTDRRRKHVSLRRRMAGLQA